MLKSLVGLSEDLITEDSILWKCSTCYTCYERCPQDVKPVEVIQSLKNLATERGLAPKEITGSVEAILQSGRAAPVSPLVQKRRRELGLDEIEPLDGKELARLLEFRAKGES
jgi:heterodisulfide reductase subunit C